MRETYFFSSANMVNFEVVDLDQNELNHSFYITLREAKCKKYSGRILLGY